jgi:hypothetical protein
VTPESEDTIIIRRPRLLLVLGAVALVLAVYIGAQVIGVLYGIIFPPPPPVPSNVTELTHTNEAHGVDDWLYGVDVPGCAVVKFYVDNGATCVIAPTMCNSQDTPSPNTPGQHVATCTGQSKFSIFAMKWEATIAEGYTTQGQTHFRLLREVYWTGAVPQTHNMQELVNQLEASPEATVSP